MQRICAGLVPEQMEDKWFVYWKDDHLFLHRSWTGYCVYVVRFVAEEGRYKMTEAYANRDPGQCRNTGDERDAAMISFLIDTLLLRREAESSSTEVSSEKRALMMWSLVGRAMLGRHPNADADGLRRTDSRRRSRGYERRQHEEDLPDWGP